MAGDRPGLPRLITEVPVDEPAPELLLAAVAKTLNLSIESIHLFDSFVDLGGDEESAKTLKQVCRENGFNIESEDSTRCSTLAELQTRITPFRSRFPSNPVTPKTGDSDEESEVSASSRVTHNIFSPGRRQGAFTDSMSSYYSTSPRTSTGAQSLAMVNGPADLETLLLSIPAVNEACLVTPMAGPLDGQLVALITLSNLPSSASDSVSLPPVSDYSLLQTQIHTLRTAVQEWGCESPRPQVWVVLQSMGSYRNGKPDLRSLQTWVQNINAEIYGQIISLQTPGPRYGTTDSLSTQSLILSRPKPLKCRRGTDETIHIDWEEPSLALEEVEHFPLSTMQELCFRISTNQQEDSTLMADSGFRFSQSILLHIKGGAELPEIEAAVEAVVARHPMLRARFRLTEEGWAQVIIPQASKSYRFGHHNICTHDEVLEIIELTQAVLDPIQGPVFAVEHLQSSNNAQFLYLVAHRLVVDQTSWRVITHDLDELLQKGNLLSEPSISFPHWVGYQNMELGQRLAEPPLPFDIVPANLEYWGLDRGSNGYSDTERSSFHLSTELISILQGVCNQTFRTEPADIFLAALLLSFSQTFQDRVIPTIWNRERGRGTSCADFNVMETVGCFDSLCPIGVAPEAKLDLLQLLKLVKDTRHAIPQDGAGLFASAVSATEGNTRVSVEVMFSFVSDFRSIQRPGGILKPVVISEHKANSFNSDVGSEVGRIALFEFSVQVDDSGAHVECLYDRNSRHRERIRTWMQNFEHLVLEAIGELRYHEPELTLSDVPLLRTSYEALAELNSDRLVDLGLHSVNDVETIYPVTPAQQEIIIAQGQDSETYLAYGTYELQTQEETPVDTSRLCSAWEQIVAMNPAMRSIFIDAVSRDALFDQAVLKKISPSILFIESEEPEEALARLSSPKTSPGKPRHRLAVCETSDKILVRVDASQAICDLMSIQNLMLELCKVYSGLSPSYSNALHHTYLYQLSSLDTTYSMEVWKAKLLDAKQCLFPRLTDQANGQQLQQTLDFEVSRQQITNYCQTGEVTLSTVLQLAWALVLRAFAGLGHVSFGYQFSGREEELLPGIDASIGSFATNLPCSIDLSLPRTISQCLEYLKESLKSSHQHQNVTMSGIQHNLRNKNESLFNTCLFFQELDYFRHDTSELRLEDLTASTVTCSSESDSDLCLTAMFAKDQLHVNLRSRYLSKNQGLNIMSTFERAVKVVLESPSCQIADIDLFTDRDYAQLVVQDWECSQRSKLISACLHTRILQHAQLQPEAPAVCSWDGQISYGQLADLVTTLGAYLVDLGVGPGSTVPVVLEKNRWTPVIMLAVMQAGASFVALDCQDKLTVESTIRELNPHVVLATETAWKDLGTVVLNLVIVNDTFFATLPPQTSNPIREVTPEHAACVFISPGNTSAGGSRNIFFTHESLCSVFVAQGPALKIDNRSRVLQLSAFNVDIALVEILGTMVHGGCVCIPSAKERVNNLAGAIARMKVSWSYMTGVLARKLDPKTLPSLKTLCFRTRKLDEDTYRPWLKHVSVLLAYGAPDVCPLGISVTEIMKHNDLGIIPPPLTGRFWVLNPEYPQRLMPVGAIGELAIESPIVTPHKFVLGEPLIASIRPSSPTAWPKTRYLKTGHRVRFLDDGNVQFISSIRDEVVVDGSAVDVASIEQQMRRCIGQGIDVAIQTITTRDSVNVLAAFLELGETHFCGPQDFENLSHQVKEQAFTAKRLVEASMGNLQSQLAKSSAQVIPSAFIPLKRFPISASLKVNRRKLQRMVAWLSHAQLLEMASIPNQGEVQISVLSQKPLPLTQHEERMRALWARVIDLPISKVSGSSSFLAVGGDRFLAAELAIACRREGLKISLNELLNGSTLTEVCRAMDGTECSSLTRAPTVLANVDKKFIKDIIAPQIGVPWQEILDVAEASSYQVEQLELGISRERADITCIVLSFNGQIRRQRLESALNTLSTVHPALCTAFAIHDRHVYQVLSSSFKPVLERRTCSLHQFDHIAEEMTQLDQGFEFKLSEPVTKFTFLDDGQQGKLIIRVSKAQIDDASVFLLVQDLILLYEQTSTLSTRSNFFQYMHAAEPVNHYAGMEYWKKYLEGAKMTQVIAHSKPCLATSQVTTIQESVHLRLLEEHGMTVDTVVKAAWAVVLATFSNGNDVLFGEIVQGHNIKLPETIDLASMVGPLENTIPVRVRFASRRSTPLGLLKHLQDQRSANRRFESLGILDLVPKCTEWPAWTKFSTVVHHDHRTQFRLDGSTTFNMGSTTFTYKTIQSDTRYIPDLLVRSTLEGPERVNLAIEFAESRVSKSLAEDALKLLIDTIRVLTDVNTATQPVLPSSEEISRSTKQIPLLPGHIDGLKVPAGHLLPHDQRVALQTLITKAWSKILDPSVSRVSDTEAHQTCFYDLWGSLLPAHSFAHYLNQELPRLNIKGLDKIHLTAEDIVDNPTMLAQFELIISKLRQDGMLSLPSRRKTMSFKPDSLGHASTPWTPKPSSPSSQPATWKSSLRKLRGHERGASVAQPQRQSWRLDEAPGGRQPR
ncbi:hypothetical protein G7046_g5711 [Stylonectria norvegica]|nr:hypothetical protein G7046_g5711 [Stylonectria norvegica]